ncbi:MAG: hypothetical protein IKT40_12310 [Bacilli bacterium]|nr:hypothetical protein [Bacilli bacterium]
MRNGLIGLVSSFNGAPLQIIFRSYTSPVGKYDNDLKFIQKKENPSYDIVEVYDGSTIKDPKKAFTKNFTVEGLELLWKREE